VDDRVERWRTLCDIRNKTFRSIGEGKRTFGGLKAYLRATDHTSSNIISRDKGVISPPWFKESHHNYLATPIPLNQTKIWLSLTTSYFSNQT
jgi:hypothetical protein